MEFGGGVKLDGVTGRFGLVEENAGELGIEEPNSVRLDVMQEEAKWWSLIMSTSYLMTLGRIVRLMHVVGLRGSNFHMRLRAKGLHHWIGLEWLDLSHCTAVLTFCSKAMLSCHSRGGVELHRDKKSMHMQNETQR